jgi:hypothetical protein
MIKMKMLAVVCIVALCGCSTTIREWPDAAPIDAGVVKEAAHVCGAFECGSPGCDACPGNMQCGDNGLAGQCGNACVPENSNGICWNNDPNLYIDYVQYPSNCNYINISECIYVTWKANHGLPAISVWCCNPPDGGSSVMSDPTGSAAGF